MEQTNWKQHALFCISIWSPLRLLAGCNGPGDLQVRTRYSETWTGYAGQRFLHLMPMGFFCAFQREVTRELIGRFGPIRTCPRISGAQERVILDKSGRNLFDEGPLVKEITAPVPTMYSGNNRKCIATYLSKATPIPSTGMGDRGYKWLVHYSTIFGCGSIKTFTVFASAAVKRLFLLLGIKHESKTWLKIRPVWFSAKMIWQWKHWQRWQFTRPTIHCKRNFVRRNVALRSLIRNSKTWCVI